MGWNIQPAAAHDGDSAPAAGPRRHFISTQWPVWRADGCCCWPHGKLPARCRFTGWPGEQQELPVYITQVVMLVCSGTAEHS